MNGIGLIGTEKLSSYIITYANTNNLYITEKALQEIMYRVDEYFLLNEGLKVIDDYFVVMVEGPKLTIIEDLYGGKGIMPLKIEKTVLASDLEELSGVEIKAINELIDIRLKDKVDLDYIYEVDSVWYKLYADGEGLNKKIKEEDILNN